MKVAETDRLVIRRLQLTDAEFILELLNDPGWLQYIGEKGVSNLKEAEHYIRSGPMDMYERLGFGLFAVELKETGDTLGICGLIKRDSLEYIDLGFAFLERHRRKGFAFESAEAVLKFAVDPIGLERIVAITIESNGASKLLLEKLGFSYLSPIEAEQDLLLYSRQLAK
ncbi:MAG: GNAT family N-acetyltransferase [Pyrinomonadaceae bacterium]|nr:GNAT family N-acetyltransferase [Pyrinomonadaceae bacterium]